MKNFKDYCVSEEQDISVRFRLKMIKETVKKIMVSKDEIEEEISTLNRKLKFQQTLIDTLNKIIDESLDRIK